MDRDLNISIVPGIPLSSTTAKFVFPSARRVESISPQGYFPVICLDNPCGLTQTVYLMYNNIYVSQFQ